MAKIATKATNPDEGKVAFHFEDQGETTLEVSANELPQEIQRQVMVHGLSQVIGDAYSGEKDPSSAVEIAKAKIERLKAGHWRKPTESTSAGPRVNQLAEALARATGKDVQECAQKVAQMKEAEDGDEQIKALRAHPQVKAQLEAIKAEKAQAKAKQLSAEASESGDISF